MANTTKVQNTGIMNKMRDKMPLIIIILIIAFLVTIVFEWGMNYMGMGGQTDAFASINKQEITYQEFERIVQQQIEQSRQQNQGKDVTDAQVKQIRDQVWTSLINQTLTKQAIDKYGIKVSDKEILDWIYNRPESLPEPIKKNFMDSTGVFNAGFYQQALNMKTKEATQFWGQVENYIRETLLSEKLQAVLSEGVVVSEGDILEKYRDDNILANFNYVLLDLNTITDSTQFAVTDGDLKKYFEDNKLDFKQNEGVKLKYVIFPDVASAEDSAQIRKQMESFQKQMKAANLEDSSIIQLMEGNSSTSWNSEFQKSNAFEVPVQNFLFNANVGDVSDVIIGEDGYQVLKLLGVKPSEELYVNAAHILIKIENDTAAAKKKADDLYARLKNGEDIGKLALEFSDDPSKAQNSGNLGWFTKGAMVKEFDDAAFNSNVGDLVGPVKSRYGFHVIKVLGKEKKEFQVAQMMRPVAPTSRSKQLAEKNAQDFYEQITKNGQNMDSLAKKQNLQVQISPEIQRDGTVPGAGQDKSLIKYFFDNKVNSISEPVKSEAGYALYESVLKLSAGYQNFDSVKTTIIKPKVINEKKYKILLGIANDLEGKITNGDINSLKNIAPQYTYEIADSFAVSKPNKTIGQDYALGTAVFNMKAGEISKPIKGSKGYYIVKVNSITEFNEADYVLKAPDIKKNLLTNKKQQIVSEWLTRMQAEAEIVDNRSKYLN
ncbi:MAG: peptidylprolyl isomerase [Ignavibacteria bacterium]